MKQGSRLRELLSRGGPVLAPGASDGLSARMIEAAGFGAIYLGGGAMARVAGYPDVGLLQLAEVAERVEKILDVTSLPLIVDADTGFGGLPNLQRSARVFARLGVAAFHIEDQVFPKRCGLLAGKELISTQEMCQKIRIAKDELGSSDALLVARCDALSVEGFSRTFDRACAYREAGAEMLFVEGLATREQLQAVGGDIPGHKMLDLYPGAESPLPRPLASQPELLAQLGFRLLVFPSDLQRAAISAMRRVLEALLRDGSTQALKDEFIAMRDRDEIVRTDEYLKLGR
jgi:2-methylisocitrate lyase-like PEP mutase family enzyme